MKNKKNWLKFLIITSLLDTISFFIIRAIEGPIDCVSPFACFSLTIIPIALFPLLIIPITVVIFILEYLSRNKLLRVESEIDKKNMPLNKVEKLKSFLFVIIALQFFFWIGAEAFFLTLFFNFGTIAIFTFLIILGSLLINYTKKNIVKKDFWLLFSIAIIGLVLQLTLFNYSFKKHIFEPAFEKIQALVSIKNKGINSEKQLNQNSDIPQPKSNETSVEIPKNETATWKTYTNTEYGFSLNFPQTWKGYTTKNRTLNWGSFGTSDSIDFGFSFQDSLFNISIHTKNKWQQIKSEEGPTPTYLGENSQYVFGYATSQDAANDTVVARMSEISTIVKTFKVTK